MRLFVGVDGGGSKTTVAVGDESGRVLGRGTGGPSNYNAVGIEVAAERVWGAIAEAVREAAGEEGPGAGREVQIAGLCLALAGVARPDDHAAWRDAVTQWITLPGPAWTIKAADAVITHDAMAALVGGTGKREGVVVIAGTGTISFGANAAGQEARASGWGYLLGDEGSGYWIGLAGLRAVCRAGDRRGPSTALTDALLAAKGLHHPRELVRAIYSEWKPVDIAALAPVVLQVAADGDPIAQDITQRAATELTESALAVLRQLDLLSHPTEIVTTGGLWEAPLLRAEFGTSLKLAAPHATVISPRDEPVTGALLLARGAA